MSLAEYPPPSDAATFESFCLDLWREIWGDPHAQLNGRRGQKQDGVDVFGSDGERWIGVQCKQKSGLLHKQVTVGELEKEVKDARGFEPKLDDFLLATTAPRNGEVQQRARQLTAEHRERGLFTVTVVSWQDLLDELGNLDEAARQRLVRKYWPERGTRRIDFRRLPGGAPKLFGREDELAELDAAWTDPAIHAVVLVAWGGVGKTALVARWAGSLAERDYDGADVFDWSFYSQGTREKGGASADAFVKKALEFFGDADMAASAASPSDKGARLAKLVARRKTLLVLDGLEPLQHPPGPLAGELQDPAVRSLLRGLAASSAGLCVVTTREPIQKDLDAFLGGTVRELRLSHLAVPAGVELLKSVDVHGAEKEIEEVVEEVRGHALTLNLLGRFLRDAHGGDVRRRDRVAFEEADAEVLGGHAFRVMAAYERWLAGEGPAGEAQLAILRLLGLFDRPASAECLEALRREPAIAGLTEPLFRRKKGWRNWFKKPEPMGDQAWEISISRLESCRLASRDGTSLDAHPLVREYFGRQLRERHPEGWRAAHGRLFDHLQEKTEHQPDTLDGLQPLYQAVVHGCQAGREQEACDKVYFDRISRGAEAYVVHKLGAFGADLGAVACFFESPWSRVAPSLTEADQAWLLNEAAFSLRALGRLAESAEPMRTVLDLVVKQKDWERAAISASNLSELELTLGDVDGAVRDAERSVEYADRSGDEFLRMVTRTVLAEALHQAGRRGESRDRFREAEEIQVKSQPGYPLLYSLRGFQYCDLLLGDAERAAWRGEADADGGEVEACGEVEKRAAQTLEWAKQHRFLLDIALDHLTLGRAALYRAVLKGSDPSAAASEIEQAVDGLRQAGDVEFIARGLLTRAWLRALTGNAGGAVEDLDEAQEIAERGSMALHLADVHLHRARLFGDVESLEKARRLIEKHGYGRRREELEDASRGRVPLPAGG